MATPPSPTDILTDTNEVTSGTVTSVFQLGIRGFIYSGALFVLSIVTGFINIIQTFLEQVAGGTGAAIASFLGGISRIITTGAIQTANNFLLGGAFSFVEALGWTFLAVYLLSVAFEQFDTDFAFIPGFRVIPFFGDGDDEGDDD